MSLPDIDAGGLLEEEVVLPVFFIFIDIEGDVLRANTSGRDLEIAGSPQPDLNGYYTGIDGRIATVSPIKIQPGGTDTVTATLRGLSGLDDDFIETINDETNWQGRTCRIWRMLRDESKVQVGGIQHYYTGYLTDLSLGGSVESQTIQVDVENYIAVFSAPSMMNYLMQEDFDPDDLSGRATIAIANGSAGNPLSGITPAGGGAGPGLGGGVNLGGLGGGGSGPRDNLHRLMDRL